MRYDELSALSPVVRKEVLTGELSRRVKGMGIVPDDDLEAVVASLVGLSLSEVLQGIEDPARLSDQVQGLRNTLKPQTSSPSKSSSPAASQDSRLLDPASVSATASAPEHPSTPVSLSPPRTSSPSGSVPPTSERDRIFASICKLESSRREELTDLLMSLPKRERAMCLFNVEVLRSKLIDAKIVLDSEDGDDDQKLSDTQSTKSAPQATPETPQKKSASSGAEESPKTPALSSKGPSAASSPSPATPGGAGTGATHTITSLAKMPASEIIRLASTPSGAGLLLPKADPFVTQATDEFMDSLRDKPIPGQKQQLGDKL